MLVLVDPGDVGGWFLTGIITTVVPIGLGIYGLRRGRKARPVEVQGSSDERVQMKQSPRQRKSGWFWVGVTLLSISALLWLTLIVGAVAGPQDIGTFLGGVLFTVVPIGVGIYCVVRGRKARPVEVQGSSEAATKPLRETQQWWAWTAVIQWWAWTAVIFVAMLTGIFVALGLIFAVRTLDLDSWWVIILVPIGLGCGLLVDFAEKRRKRHPPGIALATIKSLESSKVKFSMQVVEQFEVTLETGASGIVVEGRVQQGSIQKGDDVQIIEKRHMRKVKVFDVDTLNGSGGHGKIIRLTLEDVTEGDAK